MLSDFLFPNGHPVKWSYGGRWFRGVYVTAVRNGHHEILCTSGPLRGEQMHLDGSRIKDAGR